MSQNFRPIGRHVGVATTQLVMLLGVLTAVMVRIAIFAPILGDQQVVGTHVPVATHMRSAQKASWLRRLIRALLRVYMRLWHGLQVEGLEHLPPEGPALVLCNHGSIIDTPALMSVDPYANSTTVVKASMFKVPLVRQVLMAWGAVPVERRGRDVAGLRHLLAALKEGRVVAIAAEGRRTRSGHLERIHPVLAHIAARVDVPVIPVGIIGSFQALPPGALLPRRHKIGIRVGQAFRLPRGTPTDVAAARIRDAIAALLPPEQQPVSSPVA